MKVEYVNQNTPVRLKAVSSGEVFRPTNSQRLYIATDLTALDDLFTDSVTVWDSYVDNPQGIMGVVEYDTFGDWVVCYDIEFKTICVMHSATEVCVLNATLQVEE